MPDGHISGGVTPTPRKSSLLKVPNLTQTASFSRPRPQLVPTPLNAVEAANAAEVWDSYVKTLYVTTMADLNSLLSALQVPLQPLSRKVCDDEFRLSKGRFSFRDFVLLLERLKTLHAKWQHKLRGKDVDDDLLEAFVAVGGGADSKGAVDIAKMRAVVGEFHLNVDLDRIIADMDNDGNADIDFGEFASLIRDEQKKKKKTLASGTGSSRYGSKDDDDDTFSLGELDDDDVGGGGGGKPVNTTAPLHGVVAPITLSSMMYVDEDADQALLYPTLGLTARKDGGELSTRRKSEFSLLSQRKRSLPRLDPHAVESGGAPLTPGGQHLAVTPHQAGSASPAGANAKKGGAKGGVVVAGSGRAAASHGALRTVLAPGHGKSAAGSGGAPGVGGGATAFYKGGGGLRNMTPSPIPAGATRNEDGGGAAPRASSVMSSPAKSSGGAAGVRGLLQQKKHKFAN